MRRLIVPIILVIVAENFAFGAKANPYSPPTTQSDLMITSPTTRPIIVVDDSNIKPLVEAAVAAHRALIKATADAIARSGIEKSQKYKDILSTIKALQTEIADTSDVSDRAGAAAGKIKLVSQLQDMKDAVIENDQVAFNALLADEKGASRS